MIIRNNSKRKWKQYHIGNEVYVDIEPLKTFEIEDEVKARKLLSLLGSPNWLVEVKEEPKKEVKKKPKKEKKPKVKKIKKKKTKK